MNYPAVRHYGDIEMESFDEYYSRWPATLSNIPRGVVEDWIYRHWHDFSEYWVALAPHTWTYELVDLSSSEVMSIDHISTWIPELDAEGVEYVSGAPRSTTRLAQFMLKNGTFPVPIIVAKGAGLIAHPRSQGERMKEPLQLIEGHSRLACIRGMINSNYSTLKGQHLAWCVSIPVSATS